MKHVILPGPMRLDGPTPAPLGAESQGNESLSLCREISCARRKARALSATFYQNRAARSPDRDNRIAAFKAAQDGIADALSVVDRRIFTHEFGDRCKGRRVIVGHHPDRNNHTVQREHHMNRVTLLGRPGKDPEIRTTDQARRSPAFRSPRPEQWKDKATGEKKERTEWHSIVVWGALAGTNRAVFQKGNRVYLEGAQRTRKWQDQNGAGPLVHRGCPVRLQLHLAIIDWPEGSGRGEGPGRRLWRPAAVAARSDGRRDPVWRRNDETRRIAERLGMAERRRATWEAPGRRPIDACGRVTRWTVDGVFQAALNAIPTDYGGKDPGNSTRPNSVSGRNSDIAATALSVIHAGCPALQNTASAAPVKVFARQR